MVQDFQLMTKLADHAMIEEEWHRYKSRLTDVRNLGGRLVALGGRLPKAMEKVAARWVDYENFYRLAVLRNRTMVERMAGRLDGSSYNYGLLVAGGFHANGLTELLNEKGYTVLAVSPKITQIDPSAPNALEFLAANRKPLDQLFAGERLFIPVAAATQSVGTRRSVFGGLWVAMRAFWEFGSVVRTKFAGRKWRAQVVPAGGTSDNQQVPNGLQVETVDGELIIASVDNLDPVKAILEAILRDSFFVRLLINKIKKNEDGFFPPLIEKPEFALLVDALEKVKSDLPQGQQEPAQVDVSAPNPVITGIRSVLNSRELVDFLFMIIGLSTPKEDISNLATVARQELQVLLNESVKSSGDAQNPHIDIELWGTSDNFRMARRVNENILSDHIASIQNLGGGKYVIRIVMSSLEKAVRELKNREIKFEPDILEEFLLRLSINHEYSEMIKGISHDELERAGLTVKTINLDQLDNLISDPDLLRDKFYRLRMIHKPTDPDPKNSSIVSITGDNPVQRILERILGDPKFTDIVLSVGGFPTDQRFVSLFLEALSSKRPPTRPGSNFFGGWPIQKHIDELMELMKTPTSGPIVDWLFAIAGFRHWSQEYTTIQKVANEEATAWLGDRDNWKPFDEDQPQITECPKVDVIFMRISDDEDLKSKIGEGVLEGHIASIQKLKKDEFVIRIIYPHLVEAVKYWRDNRPTLAKELTQEEMMQFLIRLIVMHECFRGIAGVSHENLSVYKLTIEAATGAYIEPIYFRDPGFFRDLTKSVRYGVGTPLPATLEMGSTSEPTTPAAPKEEPPTENLENSKPATQNPEPEAFFGYNVARKLVMLTAGVGWFTYLFPMFSWAAMNPAQIARANAIVDALRNPQTLVADSPGIVSRLELALQDKRSGLFVSVLKQLTGSEPGRAILLDLGLELEPVHQGAEANALQLAKGDVSNALGLSNSTIQLDIRRLKEGKNRPEQLASAEQILYADIGKPTDRVVVHATVEALRKEAKLRKAAYEQNGIDVSYETALKEAALAVVFHEAGHLHGMSQFALQWAGLAPIQQTGSLAGGSTGIAARAAVAWANRGDLTPEAAFKDKVGVLPTRYLHEIDRIVGEAPKVAPLLEQIGPSRGRFHLSYGDARLPIQNGRLTLEAIQALAVQPNGAAATRNLAGLAANRIDYRGPLNTILYPKSDQNATEPRLIVMSMGANGLAGLAAAIDAAESAGQKSQYGIGITDETEDGFSKTLKSLEKEDPIRQIIETALSRLVFTDPDKVNNVLSQQAEGGVVDITESVESLLLAATKKLGKKPGKISVVQSLFMQFNVVMKGHSEISASISYITLMPIESQDINGKVTTEFLAFIFA